MEAILGWKSAIFGAAVSQSVAAEVQQSEKKTKQDFAFFALRGVEEEILQALLEASKEERRKDDTEERRKKQQQWRPVDRHVRKIARFLP